MEGPRGVPPLQPAPDQERSAGVPPQPTLVLPQADFTRLCCLQSQFVCLAGPREQERRLVLELIKKYDGYNFIVLLNAHLKFRGLYVCNHDGTGAAPP